MTEKVAATTSSSPRKVALLASAAALALLGGQQALAQPTGAAPRPAPSAGPGSAPRMPEVSLPGRAPAQAAAAPTTLTAFILRGRAVRGSRAADASAPTQLTPGMRVESPPGTWTEIAFSDGSSIVIQAGGDFTLQGMGNENGRLVIRGTSSRGSLRVSTSDGVELHVATGGAEVRFVSGSAVVEAGPNGSVTMLSGRRVTVRRNGGGEDIIRRPGFAVALAGGGPERRTRGQITASLAPFAPVQIPEGEPRRPSATQEPGEVGDPTLTPRETEQQARRLRSDSLVATARPSAGRSSGLTSGTGGYVALAGAGSTISGGGASILGSTTTGFNAHPGPGSPSEALMLGGIEARQELGTGRVRRTPAPPPDAPNGRIDTGQVEWSGRREVVGARFAGPTASPQAATDLVANLAFVTLSTFSPSPSSSRANVLHVPYLSVSTSGTPNARYITSGFDQLNPNVPRTLLTTPLATVTVPRIRRNDGVVIGATTLNLHRDAVYIFEGNGASPIGGAFFSTYGLDGLNSVQIADRFYTALRASGYYERYGFDGVSVNGPGIRGSVRLLEFNSSSIFETRLHALPRDTSPGSTLEVGPLPRSLVADGSVTPMPSGGAAIYFANQNPPDAFLVRNTSANPGQGELDENGQPTLGFDDNGKPRGLYNYNFPESRPTRYTLIYDSLVSRSNPDFAEQIRTGALVEGERYFVISGTPVAPTASGMPGVSGRGNVTRYAISDGLNPSGGVAAGRSVESQFLAPGDQSQPVLFNRHNAFRPEGTFIAGAPRADTHLLVVSGNGATPNVAMRVDMDFAPGGARSASVSVGGVGIYAPLDTSGVSLVLSGNTVGTARLGGGPVAIGGRFGSLGTDASGRHGHMFYGAESGEQVGHFAVGQQDVRRGTPGTDGGQPGTVENLGGDSSPFGFTRLATNVSARPNAAPTNVAAQGGTVNYLGFATAMVETPQGSAMNLHSVSAPGYGMALARADGSNEFTAVIDLTPRAPGHMALNPFAAAPTNGASGTQRMEFGARAEGDTPTTAWIGAGTFAGVRPGTRDGHTTRADGAALFSVDATLQQVVPSTPNHQMPTSDSHLAWGYFLGDLANDSGGARRDHVNLGFWVAGRPVDFATLSTLRGTFTYTGGMIGTVAQNGGVRVGAGGFAHTWDFGSRTGRLAATFDGRDYNARVAMLGTNPIFTGSGLDAQRDRRMVVQGGFFGTSPAGTPPPAVGGAFGIAGSGYAATGIFAGRRVP